MEHKPRVDSSIFADLEQAPVAALTKPSSSFLRVTAFVVTFSGAAHQRVALSSRFKAEQNLLSPRTGTRPRKQPAGGCDLKDSKPKTSPQLLPKAHIWERPLPPDEDFPSPHRFAWRFGGWGGYGRLPRAVAPCCEGTQSNAGNRRIKITADSPNYCRKNDSEE